MRVLVGLVIVIILLHFQSCASPQIPNDPNKIYKMDADVATKEFSANGMLAVTTIKPLYTIEVNTSDKISFISLRTCSRETTSSDPGTILNRKKYVVNYAPNEIERAGACPVLISAFNEKGTYSVGFIDFIDPSTTLPAESVCGAITSSSNGISVCQERVSSMELIRFPVEVMTSPEKGCEMTSPNRGKEFTYRVKKGFCTYPFIEVEEPHRIHRLTVFGYESAQVR